MRKLINQSINQSINLYCAEWQNKYKKNTYNENKW